jgi:hypothetical protein
LLPSLLLLWLIVVKVVQIKLRGPGLEGVIRAKWCVEQEVRGFLTRPRGLLISLEAWRKEVKVLQLLL